MDVVNYDFDLEMIPGLALPKRLNVSKDDIGRTYTAALKWNGANWTPGSATAKIQATKPDGTVYDGTATISGASVSFTLAEEMAQVSGAVLCQIQFIGSSKKIGSENFIIEVERGTFDPSAPSESELSTFDELYTNAQAALTNATATLNSIPQDYTTTVSEVDKLTGNDDNYCVQVFPKAEIASNTDLNNVYIGDYYCSSSSRKNSLSHLPSGVDSVFRLEVFSITRDGATAPAESVPWIRRKQIITDATGRVFIRFGTRGNATTAFTWGDWQSDKDYTDTKTATCLSDSKSYTDTKTATCLSNAKSYADTKTATCLSDAKDYTDTKTATCLSDAKDYTDNSYAETTLENSKSISTSSTDTILRAARLWWGTTLKVKLNPTGHFLVLVNQTAVYLGWFAGSTVAVNFTRVGGSGGVTASASLSGNILTITASEPAAITVLYCNGERYS